MVYPSYGLIQRDQSVFWLFAEIEMNSDFPVGYLESSMIIVTLHGSRSGLSKRTTPQKQQGWLKMNLDEHTRGVLER